MRYVLLILIICHSQGLSAVEYILDESALHVNARDLGLGGLICSMESIPDELLECTYLMPYQLKELSIRKLSLIKKKWELEWTFGWSQTGNSDWMENMLNLHLGKQLNKQIQVGIDIDVLLQQDAAENHTVACFAQVDCRYAFSESTTFGLTLLNPGGAQIRTESGLVPLSSAAFFATKIVPAKSCAIYAELGIWLNQRTKKRIGLEWILTDSFIIRTGVSTQPVRPSWGIGGHLHGFRYSWGGDLHPLLGVSNGFSLNYSW